MPSSKHQAPNSKLLAPSSQLSVPRRAFLGSGLATLGGVLVPRAVWAAETPQVARTDWLREAFAECRRRGVTPTDDAQALELCGHRPVLVENRASNLKVTRPEDLALVRAILAARRRDGLSPLPIPNLPR